METLLLDRLDSNLAKAMIERIEEKPEDLDFILTNLDRIRKLCDRTPKIKQSLRNTLDFILKNSSLPDTIAEQIEIELNSLGGPIVDRIESNLTGRDGKSDPAAAARFGDLLQPAYQIKANIETGAWVQVNEEESEIFLSKIKLVDGKYSVDVTTTTVAWTPLSFYTDVALIRLCDPLWTNPDLVVYYLTLKGNIFRLNGTSPPIHEVNIKAPINLTNENVSDYVNFFCFFVRGDEGPFCVIESIDDSVLPADLDESTRSLIEKSAFTVRYNGQDEQGNFLCDALIFYSNALFESSFVVKPTGMIEMQNDKPVAGELLSKIVAPIA